MTTEMLPQPLQTFLDQLPLPGEAAAAKKAKTSDERKGKMLVVMPWLSILDQTAGHTATSSGTPFSTATEEAEENVEVVEEDDFAAIVAKYGLELASNRLRSLLWYTEQYPGKFALLLSDCEEVVNKGFDHLRKTWDALFAQERWVPQLQRS